MVPEQRLAWWWGVEGGAGLAPHLTANRLGLTRLVVTASYNGYQVWYLNRG